MARKIYNGTPEKERLEKKRELARILSVSASTVQNWLSRIDKDAKDARNKRIFDKWLACWTQEEIAAGENIHKDTISEICRDFPDLEKSDKSRVTGIVILRLGYRSPVVIAIYDLVMHGYGMEVALSKLAIEALDRGEDDG